MEELLDKFSDEGYLLEDGDILKEKRKSNVNVVENFDKLKVQGNVDNLAGHAGAEHDRSE